MRVSLIALAVAGVVAQAALAADFKVNGVVVPQARMDVLMKDYQKRGQQDTPELRNQLKDRLVLTEALAQEAQKAGLDKSPEYVERVEALKRELLANAYVTNYMEKNTISDAAAKVEYDKAKPDMDKAAAQQGKLYRIRHILVKDEKTANEVLGKLKKGGNFADLAKQYTTDPGSKENGGLYDFAPAEQYVKPFADAVKALAKGQITQKPVKTQFGYHVILLEDSKTPSAPGFDEVKEQIKQQLQQQQLDKLLTDAKTSAKVE